MKALSPQTALFALLASLGTVTADAVRGVDPVVAANYVAQEGKFTCLDGSKAIPFSAVNDDYCDCPDGSDEPGTSACEGRPGAFFYCENKGHIPGRILASRVNDGICDPECCDGSDEWASGACPDRCAAIAKEHRERLEAEAKTRRTGAKIRSTYIKFAQKEKQRIESELASKRAEVAEKERKVAETKSALDSAEAQSRDNLERRKSTPLFKSLESHREAVVKLQNHVQRVEQDLQTVLQILDELSKGYNPNGQDMAVKAAVVGYKELVGQGEAIPAEHVEDEPVEGDTSAETEDVKPDVPPEAKLYTIADPQGELEGIDIDAIVRQDLESVLLSSDDRDDDDDSLFVYRIEEYIPDSMFDYYDTVRDTVVQWLTSMGVLKGKAAVSAGPHAVAARQRHDTAVRELNDIKRDIENAEGQVKKLDTDKWYGPEGEFKKLDGTCIDAVFGDYTYELCFFGGAKQKSNKDHSSNNLGNFVDWNPSAERGSLDYYSKMQFRNGAKCWNGPMRSVNVELSCGTANAILSVTEPEKCEYRFKATSPALCWPEGASSPVKDEL